MTYKAKAEDVPEEITRKGITAQFAVDILNLAIEAGLVSPPCHVHRYLGELECQGGTIDPALFVGKPRESGDEHWKGQTS